MVIDACRNFSFAFSAATNTRQASATKSSPLTGAHFGTVIAADRPVLSLGTAIRRTELTGLTVGLRDLYSSGRTIVTTVTYTAAHLGLLVVGHLLGIVLLSRCDVAIATQTVGRSLIDLVRSPYHKAAETARGGEIPLLLERITVIV